VIQHSGRKGAAGPSGKISQCQGPDRHSLPGPGLEKPQQGAPCAEIWRFANFAQSAAPAQGVVRCCCGVVQDTNRAGRRNGLAINGNPLAPTIRQARSDGTQARGWSGSLLWEITGWLELGV